jgi:hypothetical protein
MNYVGVGTNWCTYMAEISNCWGVDDNCEPLNSGGRKISSLILEARTVVKRKPVDLSAPVDISYILLGTRTSRSRV